MIMRTPISPALLPLFPLFIGALASPLAAQDSFALYDVQFQATWSAATHPTAYPTGAHFSALVGGTHDASVAFWTAGGLASPGIEAMAEIGSTVLLQGEVNAAVGLGQARAVVLGPQVPISPGTVATSLIVTEQHPLVTLVTMIAPSPDWFVGVSGQPLLVGGQWLEQLDVPLFAWDAGSDSGPGFVGPNVDTVPKEPIALIASGPLGGAAQLGIFRFQRRLSTLVYGSGINPAGSLTVLGGVPRLGQTMTLGLADPSGSLAVPAATYLAATDAPGPFFPAGILVQNTGLSMAGTPGEFLLGGNLVESLNGASWNGTSVPFSVPIPNLPGLVDASFYLQGIFLAPTPRIGLTEALELHIGP